MDEIKIGETSDTTPEQINENMEKLKYVVSEDVPELMKAWLEKTGRTVPDENFWDNFTESIKTSFTDIFGKENFDFIEDNELRDGLNKLIEESDIPVVSMDRTYDKGLVGDEDDDSEDKNKKDDLNNTKHFGTIDISRHINDNQKSVGLYARADGSDKALLGQFRDIIKKLKEENKTEIALVDDVVFTGGLVNRISNIFKKNEIAVTKVYAGILIGGKDSELNEDIEVEAVRRYDEGVVDQVCQRDFIPGVPFSGRSLLTLKGKKGRENYGASYIEPFGNTKKWGSIPENNSTRFSKEMIDLAIDMYSKIDEVNNEKILLKDLPRKIAGYDSDEFQNMTAVEFLKLMKLSLELEN